MLSEILVSVVVVVALFLLYLLLVYRDAKQDVASSPREDMFICEKSHGAFPKRHAYQLEGVPYPVCPFCYEDAVKQAAAQRRADSK